MRLGAAGIHIEVSLRDGMGTKIWICEYERTSKMDNAEVHPEAHPELIIPLATLFLGAVKGFLT